VHPKLPHSSITLSLCWLLVALIAAADALTGDQANLSQAYVLPVLLASWAAGLTWGLVFSGAAVGLLLAVGLLAGNPFQQVGVFVFTVISEAGTYALIAWLASGLAHALDRERRRARIDALTGLASRAVLFDVIQREIERQRRYGHPLAIAYFDLDESKAVNKARAHVVADQVLAAVAETLRNSLRRTDCIARLGGDEFAILLPETSADQAQRAVDLMCTKLMARVREAGWPIDFSVGLAAFSVPPASPGTAVQAADRLMYRAKAQGKGRVVSERY
jgi:diguanylate cyclase (GGDEF)-like protein